jgi:hypothetical protein
MQLMDRLTDFFRLAWGLVYWNLRKERYRRAHGRRRCPCQAPSDSGRALETQCEAAMSWHDQRRFRRVCPLLVETPAGLRCSVNTADVRPFWGKCLRAYSLVFLSLYLALGLTVFASLRLIGYPLPVSTVLWPGHWGRFHLAQADYYQDKGLHAMAAGDLRTASMSLYLAHQLDPGHFEAGLIHAQISTLVTPADSDAVFRDLLAAHPDKAALISERWLYSALPRGSFATIRDLALDRIKSPDTQAQAPWIHALVMSTRQLRDDATLDKLGALPEGARWQDLLTTELLLRSGRKDQALRKLGGNWIPHDPYKTYYQVWQLILLNRPHEAQMTAGANRQLVSGDEQLGFQMAVTRLLSQEPEWRRYTQSLLHSGALTPAVLDVFSVHLVRFPDPLLLQAILTRLQQYPVPASDAGIRAYLSLYCAAGVCGDANALDQLGTALRIQLGRPLYALNQTRSHFTDPKTRIRLQDFLTAFPIPLTLEMQWTLYEHDRLMKLSTPKPLEHR